MAYLRAALDASYAHPTLVHSVAGYLACDDEWFEVLKIWQEGLSYWGLQKFHLAELPKLMGHERGQLCEKFFRRIIERSGLISIGAAIFENDYNEPDWRGDNSPRFGTAYQQTLWFAFGVLSEECALEFPNSTVKIVCDIDGPEDDILDVFTQAQKKHPRLESIEFSNSRNHPELQLADLAAGYLRKSWANILTDASSNLRWGVIPSGMKGGRSHGRTSVWSLRQGAIISRAWELAKRASEQS